MTQSEDATLKTAMDSDRLLLEKAAKAAGMDIGKNRGQWQWWDFMECFNRQGANSGASFMWNPLRDDRDALRLAVKLRLQLCVYEDQVECMDTCEPYKQGRETLTNTFVRIEPTDAGEDPYAATRRAIVRAAAAMADRAAASLSDQVGRTQ